MKIGILAVTSGGNILAQRLAEVLGGTMLSTEAGVKQVFVENWQHYDGFVCIMATGIAVRAIAPLLKSKLEDPCMVVVDEKGRYAISLLSGHLGGGNELAGKVAELTNGQAVITTASDVLELPSLDLWANEHKLIAEDQKAVTRASAKLVNEGQLRLYCEVVVSSLPASFVEVNSPEMADVIVSERDGEWPVNVLLLRLKNLVVGVGCNRGTPASEIEDAMWELFQNMELSLLSIRNLASIDLKNDEAGLLEFAEKNGWVIDFYNKDALNTIEWVEHSEEVLKATGAIGVSEPAALLSANSNSLIIRKKKWQNVTLAVAKADFTLSEPAQVQ